MKILKQLCFINYNAYSYAGNVHFSPCNDDEYQEKYIQTLEKHLQEGGNIDKIITSQDVVDGVYYGLQLFAAFCLLPLHVKSGASCDWSDVQKHVNADIFDKTVDFECYIWGGIAPLMIATKFNRIYVIYEFLKLGASINQHDSKGNTPLHYSSVYRYLDDGWFRNDNENSFSKLDGLSHCHIACKNANDNWNVCGDTIDMVKK